MSGAYVTAALRRSVYERAEARCEYCKIAEAYSFASHQIDHIVAVKHGGETQPGNLALSCTLCNLHKGTDLTAIDPETGKVVALYHPRRDAWDDHFQLDPNGSLTSLTPQGRATIRLLQLNRAERVQERSLLLAAGLWPNDSRTT